MKIFSKEEEFLEEFGYCGLVSEINRSISPDEWKANYDCNDNTRRNQKYFVNQAGSDMPLFFSMGVIHYGKRESGGIIVGVDVLLESSVKTIDVKIDLDDSHEWKFREKHEKIKTTPL